MKPFVLMLLIGTIVAFSDLVGHGETSRHAARRLPFAPLSRLRRRRLTASSSRSAPA
jgi:hypothetical protein